MNIGRIHFNFGNFKSRGGELLKRSKQSFRSNIISFAWGTAFSVTISFIVWVLAYFGYITLGLPDRFEYEKLDNSITSSIPDNFQYSTELMTFRNSSNSSIIVYAHEPTSRITDFTIGDLRSDVFLVMDKTKAEYKRTFEFQPVSYGHGALHVTRMQGVDLNGDGSQEVVTGWSYLGANFSNPIVLVFLSGTNGQVRILGLDTDKEGVTIHSKTGGDISSKSVYGFMTKEGSLLTYSRIDNSCSACGDEHIYLTADYSLSLYDNELSNYGMNTGKKIYGWGKLVDFAQTHGYTLR